MYIKLAETEPICAIKYYIGIEWTCWMPPKIILGPTGAIGTFLNGIGADWSQLGAPKN